VLGVYGEDLAHGARTAVFGSATLGLAEELSLRGARLVHVYDVDAGRVAEATARSHNRSIFYAPLPEGGDVGVRDGAFDFVVVPDLSLFADPASIVAIVRRVVSPLGAALIASPNADVKAPLLPAGNARHALGYYELYEAIAAHFDQVRMIGQAPFVGYAVAEMSVEDPEPTIDSSLAESEGKEPEWFLALASDRNLRLDPFALIELPVQHFAAASHAADDLIVSPVPESGPSAAGTGTVLINILEAEREAALESLRQQEQALQAERFRADRVAQDLAAAREEVDLLRERCRALGERVGEEEARAAALENRLEEARHDPEIAVLRDRLRAAEERNRSLEGSARESVGEHESEVAKLEVQLRERGREIHDLRSEVDRREKLVRELVMTSFPTGPEASHAAGSAGDNGSAEGSNGSVEVAPHASEAHQAPPGADPSLIADLSARLDRLASDAARREADLVGARWKIAQLERELMQQR
jgi:SAM-dependent methyltransferase